MHRICLNEDGALAQSSEFVKVIISFDIVIETTTWYKSTSNAKIEYPMWENHKLARIGLLMSNLPAFLQCCMCQCAICVCRQVMHSRTICTPYSLWHGHCPSVKSIKISESDSVITTTSRKLLALRIKCRSIGYGHYEMTHLSCNLSSNKITCTHYFTFDSSYSLVLSHALSPSYRNVMGNLLVQGTHVVNMPMVLDLFKALDIVCLIVKLDES